MGLAWEMSEYENKDNLCQGGEKELLTMWQSCPVVTRHYEIIK